MSSKSSFFLLVGCVSSLTMTLLMPAPTKAGFEWTPPEQSVEQEENYRVPKGSALPVPPAVVDDQDVLAIPPKKMSPVPYVEKPIKSSQPMMKTKKVIPPKEKQPSVSQVPSKPVEKQTTVARRNVIAPSPVETKQPENSRTASYKKIDKEKALVKPAKPQKVMMKDPVKDSVVVPMPAEEKVKTVKVEKTAEPKKSEGLKINPYPSRDKQIAVQGRQLPVKKQQEKIQPKPSNYTIAEGFGTDIPLALALGQIVPPTYAYSFGDGVNPGKKISWTGGKPWDEVLTDALGPVGLGFEIEGRKLILLQADQIGKTAHSSNTREERISYESEKPLPKSSKKKLNSDLNR